VEWVPPWKVTEGAGHDPFVALAAVRPDFNGALIQFLIGLAQTTFAPEDPRTWRQRLKAPPPPEALRQAFETVARAFDLDGDGPRFMQDLDELEGQKAQEATRLLIEEPGDHTMKENRDHFIKRGRSSRFCLPCAATAVFTLQVNAPSGGQGHRTSLRGGGPLTTLICQDTLWRTIWMNVLVEEDWHGLNQCRDASREYRHPWLGPTRTSERGESTTPADVPHEHMFWGMPRRIYLEFETDDEPRPCGLCGRLATRHARSYRTKPRGFNYEGGWLHPLTPHRWQDNQPIPIHGQPNGLSYKDWLGLALAASDGSRKPALTVQRLYQERIEWIRDRGLGLWAFGYDMDNMKARGWTEGRLPLVLVDPLHVLPFEMAARNMVLIAEKAVQDLLYAVRTALFGQRDDRRKKGLPHLDHNFWIETENDFYRLLRRLADGLENGWTNESTGMIDLKLEWLALLGRAAENLFEKHVWTERIEQSDVKRVAAAWNGLRAALHPNNKKNRNLLMLPDRRAA